MGDASWLWDRFDLKGRAGRGEFLAIAAIVSALVAAVLQVPAKYIFSHTFFPFVLAFWGATLFGAFAAIVRRLHDLNLSGYWVCTYSVWGRLIYWLPKQPPTWWRTGGLIAGWGFAAGGFLLLAIKPGSAGANRFGPQPGRPSSATKDTTLST